ncbi:MAG: DUF6526 family protein [Candidatus Zixiibacteriota bacterium]
MEVQNLANHRRIIPMFHAVLFLTLVLSFIGSIVNLVKSWDDHQRLYSAALLVVVFVCLLLIFYFMRAFPLRAQDRAIRAEENLRYYVMTGKLLDPRLTIRQIIGLRFAGDDEFAALAKRAADENLSEDDIKKAVKNWRGDYHRV